MAGGLALAAVTLPWIAVVYGAAFGLSVLFLMLAGPADGGGAEVEVRTVDARTPPPLMAHLVIYGVVFGVLHILEGLIQTGPSASTWACSSAAW